ncbi:unnamed protein product [Cercopithifilaria johnstoni]|uniref:Uncharacterized protein n=1 Tax=Cercopithifilaria johnstoni TaxID=2874296 RepID=A0A8J2M1V1_9BILA|nr:unnamed protein product [Cercopithifilaria johnstoni]
MSRNVISRNEIDDRFNKCLKKAMNDPQQLVKGEISDNESDGGGDQGLQKASVGKMIENFAKILLDNEKVDHADINVQMRLKNIKSNPKKHDVQFFAYDSKDSDERGGRIIRD